MKLRHSLVLRHEHQQMVGIKLDLLNDQLDDQTRQVYELQDIQQSIAHCRQSLNNFYNENGLEERPKTQTLVQYAGADVMEDGLHLEHRPLLNDEGKDFSKTERDALKCSDTSIISRTVMYSETQIARGQQLVSDGEYVAARAAFGFMLFIDESTTVIDGNVAEFTFANDASSCRASASYTFAESYPPSTAHDTTNTITPDPIKEATLTSLRTTASTAAAATIATAPPVTFNIDKVSVESTHQPMMMLKMATMIQLLFLASCLSPSAAMVTVSTLRTPSLRAPIPSFAGIIPRTPAGHVRHSDRKMRTEQSNCEAHPTATTATKVQ